MTPDTKPRLLIVDDDSDLREVVGQILEESGYEVALAENGAVALRMVEKHRPDLVLLDMKMPVMDGWQFARELRTRWGKDRPRILVLTAAADPGARASDIGAGGWIGKPFEIRDLRDEIARVMERPTTDNPL